MLYKCQITQINPSSLLNGRNRQISYIIFLFFFFKFYFCLFPTVETDAKVNNMTIISETEHSSALPQISFHRLIEKTLLAHRTILLGIRE